MIECCISKNNIYVRNVLSDMSVLVYVHFFCQVSNLCKQYFKLFVAYIKSHQFTSVCSLHDYDSHCTINKYNTCGLLLWYFNGVFGLFRRWTYEAVIWTIATWRYLIIKTVTVYRFWFTWWWVNDHRIVLIFWMDYSFNFPHTRSRCLNLRWSWLTVSSK